ncbi:hypothetical protein [Caudoviricetes sp.]|nr:hypothetical protein [Caudoviricetes sp.]
MTKDERYKMCEEYADLCLESADIEDIYSAYRSLKFDYASDLDDDELLEYLDELRYSELALKSMRE